MLINESLEQAIYRQDAILRQPDWTFDGNLGRYRDRSSGRFLSKREALALTQRGIDAAGRELREITDSLIAGVLPLGDWQRRFAQLLKELHLGQYILGRGGAAQVYPADFLTVARTLKDEYRYLDGFARDIAAGKLSEAQLRARARLYLNKTTTSYWQGDGAAQQRATQPMEMRRVLSPVENCPDCLTYASAGWVPVGLLPMPGVNCQCGANCRCSVEYRKGVDQASS
jgi:hypothetical protein